jgi:hypothetical protein
MNPMRFEDSQEQQGELYMRKEVVAIFLATKMIWPIGQPYITQKVGMHMHL